MNEVVLPLDYTQEQLIKQLSKRLKLPVGEIKGLKLFKRSLDARKKPELRYVLTVDFSLNPRYRVEDKKTQELNIAPYVLPSYRVFKQRPVVVGFGPAGMFAALILAQAGQRPIVLERGGSVEERRLQVESFWKNRVLNTECNVQFGEGGAGTFSDGKLNTGVKDKRISKVLSELVAAGAPGEILWEAKPHIGTDRLPGTVRGIRKAIEALGGEIFFNTRMDKIVVGGGRVSGLKAYRAGEELEFSTDVLILCIGHSARDSFRMLKHMGMAMEPKAFSVGARIEHRAELVDRAQYGRSRGSLPAADYKLSARLPNGRGVYTFCMCPGGTVVGAASQQGMVVTNGMSSYARDGINSNSALLVGVSPQDFPSAHALSGMELQEDIERKAFAMAGSDYSAPAQRLEDFLLKRKSEGFSQVIPSYMPGVKPCDLNKLLPDYVCVSMAEAVKELNRRLKGFSSPDAVLTGPETRSSSPVRLLRGEDMQALLLGGLYPCGEGAGYAGGIVSAAVDGIRCAEAVLQQKNIN